MLNNFTTVTQPKILSSEMLSLVNTEKVVTVANQYSFTINFDHQENFQTEANLNANKEDDILELTAHKMSFTGCDEEEEDDSLIVPPN